MAQGDVIAELAEVAKGLPAESYQDGETMLRLLWPGLASLTIEETESESLMVLIWVRTQSFHWSGERSDLNELLAGLVSLQLHRGGVSTQHVLVGHPVMDLPGEVYATYLVPRQPYHTGFPVGGNGTGLVRRLMQEMSTAVDLALMVLQTCGWQPDAEGPASQTLSASQRSWVESLTAVLHVDEHDVTFNMREKPTWAYLRTAGGVSVFSSEQLCGALNLWYGPDAPLTYAGPTGSILKRGDLLNFIRESDLVRCDEILSTLGDNGRRVLTLAMENRVLLLAPQNAIFWSADAGRAAAVDERGRIARRHSLEHGLLYDTDAVRWLRRVSAGRFEELVKVLLQQEPGVRHVRHAGLTTEPDGGRDLLVEWETPLLAGELDPEGTSGTHRVRRVVVQCKADARPVGISRVPGIGDTMDQFQAEGYLLVVRSRLTRPLVDRLDQRRATGRWIEWWEGDQLARRLLECRHIASTFGDILTIEAGPYPLD